MLPSLIKRNGPWDFPGYFHSLESAVKIKFVHLIREFAISHLSAKNVDSISVRGGGRIGGGRRNIAACFDHNAGVELLGIDVDDV